MKITLRNGNAIEELKKIPNESVDCVISSPPYYGLRSYKSADIIWGDSKCDHEFLVQNHYSAGQSDKSTTSPKVKGQEMYWSDGYCTKCGAWKGQLGLEPTYQMYIDHLMLIMKELKRVLKKTGTLFWNMGDSYAGDMGKRSGCADPKYAKTNEEGINNGITVFLKANYGNIRAKSLMMIPERFAMAMIDDGWILRNKIVWYKRNAMPTSSQDRLSNKWEHVFFFTKSQKYYFDLDSIRKILNKSEDIPETYGVGVIFDLPKTNKTNHKNETIIEKKPYAIAERDKDYIEYRNLPPLEEVADFLNKYRKEWGYTIDEIEYELNSQAPHHWFNAESYPSVDDWKRIKNILGFPDTYDKAMTEVFLKSAEKQDNPIGPNPGDVKIDESLYDPFTDPNIQSAFFEYLEQERPELLMPSIFDIPTQPNSFSHFAVFPKTLVEPLLKAGCRPDGVVLDPFAGSGTVGVVSARQNKNAILIEISPEYCVIIKKRLNWGNRLDIQYEEFPKNDIKEHQNKI